MMRRRMVNRSAARLALERARGAHRARFDRVGAGVWERLELVLLAEIDRLVKSERQFRTLRGAVPSAGQRAAVRARALRHR